MYRFNAIKIETLAGFICGTWQADSKTYMEIHRAKDIQETLGKQGGKIALPDIKTYCKAWLINTVWNIYNKNDITQCWGKNGLFKKWWWYNFLSMLEKMKLDLHHTTHNINDR